MKKAKIGSERFDEIRRELVLYVDFVALKDYRKFFGKAFDVCPDSNDVDYFALALKEGVSVWTNDRRLKGQSVVEVLNTMDVVGLIE